MVEALIPIFNGVGALATRFGQFFGPQTILSNLTVANGATITILDGAGDILVLTATGGTLTTASATGLVPSVLGISGVPVTTQPLIQAGSSVVTTNPSGDVNVLYPVSFPNSCDAFVCTNGDYNNNNHQMTSVISKGTGLTSLHAFDCTTGAAIVNTTIRIDWYAIGH